MTDPRSDVVVSLGTDGEGASQIAGGSLDRSHFRTVRPGYDRHEVDAFFREFDRFAQLAGIKAATLEEGLVCAVQQARVLESRVAELAAAHEAAASQTSAPLDELADRILGRALEFAQQVQAAIEGEGRAYREEAERCSSEMLTTAQTEAADIIESANAECEQRIRFAQEDRARAEHLRQWIAESRAALEERVAAVWRPRVEGARREAETLAGQRQASLDGLAKLHQVVATLASALKGRP